MRFLPAPLRPLSAHFSWAEVIRNSGYPAVPLGPFTLPNGNAVRPRLNARVQARKLEELRSAVNNARGLHGLPATGIRLTSWARSWEHNQAVGGARDSQHLYFRASDIAREEITRLCPWPAGAADFDQLADRVFSDGGFGSYPAGARHVDSRGVKARWSDWIGWPR